jgi:ABC-2 type transport system permease protein
MNKILLIIQREYLSRVKKKSFLILTFLVPVFVIGVGMLAGYIAMKGKELDGDNKILVADESGIFKEKMHSSGNLTFAYTNRNFDTLKNQFAAEGYDFLLLIPAKTGEIELISEKKPSTSIIGTIERDLSNVAEAHSLQAAGIDTAVLAMAQKRIEIKARQITNGEEKDAQSYMAYAIGLISGLLIYMSLLIYGTQVMRGVIEEKVSRIIEVIISSVKPMQLLLGKIIGVGLVGLTQFVLWIVLFGVLSAGAGTLMAKKAMPGNAAQMEQMGVDAQALSQIDKQQGMVGEIMQSVADIPVGYTVSCFLFYFLFGYFIYSALFAVVGSAVDNETETQQFILPVTLPIIFTLMLSQSVIINHPDGTLAIWLSMIPFTSPIAMMMRIPFGVPAWQLALSMLFLVLGFLGTTWAAARIYRVGILMYGKKASYKELFKWFMYKD